MSTTTTTNNNKSPVSLSKKRSFSSITNPENIDIKDLYNKKNNNKIKDQEINKSNEDESSVEKVKTGEKIRVIAVSAKIGCGKSHMMEKVLKKWLIDKLGLHIRVVCLADELKKLCFEKYGTSFEKMFIEKDSETRELLQKLGVSERERLGADVWIKKLDFQMKIDFSHGVDIILVADLRFENEFDYFKNRGDAVCLRIDAPQRNLDKVKREQKEDPVKMKACMEHISEVDLDKAHFDIRINNDYEDIHTASDELLNSLKFYFQAEEEKTEEQEEY